MTLTNNDRRVLDGLRWAESQGFFYAPHGTASWTGIRRLMAAGLVEFAGDAWCETCDAGHDCQGFELTAQGTALAAATEPL